MIITATDFSHRSESAIARAAAIAKRLNMPLALLHAVSPRGFFSNLLEQNKIAPADDEIRSKLNDQIADLGVLGEAIVEHSEPCGAIARIAAEKRAALIVLGDHGAFHLREIFSGTTAANAIEHTSAPVLIVKNGGGDYGRVMIAVDFSKSCHDAAAAALRLFGGAEFLVFGAYLAPDDASASYYGVATRELQTMLEEARSETLERLEKFARDLPFPKERVKILARSSVYPAETIAEIAESEGCDLLVMGTRGAAAKLSFFIGSTTDSLMRKGAVDMLVLRN